MKMKLTGLMAAMLVIAGCSSAPYKTQYTLATDGARIIEAAQQKPYGIVVGDVKSFGMGNNVDMTYSRDANTVEVYTKSAWVEPPVQQIQVAIANGLMASNAYRDVVVSPTSLTGAYKVDTTIQKMQQYFDNGHSYVELSLMVRLLNNSQQKLVFSKKYSIKEPVESLNAEGGVAAYNRALARLLPEIIRDIITQS